jgi:hypothetical protein
MTPADWKLVALALVSIGVLVLLVTRIKVNAFIALAAAALVVGTGSVFWLRVPARTATGAILSYEVLVVATGLKLDWSRIKGLPQALGQHGVVTFAPTLEQAYYSFEVLESYARILLAAKQLKAVMRILPHPLSRPRLPQPHLPVRIPPPVTHPGATVVRQPVYRPSTPTGQRVRPPTQQRIPQLHGKCLVRIEAQHKRSTGLFRSPILLLDVSFEGVGKHASATLLCEGNGRIGRTRIDHEQLVRHPGKAAQAALDIVCFVAGDDDGREQHVRKVAP